MNLTKELITAKELHIPPVCGDEPKSSAVFKDGVGYSPRMRG